MHEVKMADSEKEHGGNADARSRLEFRVCSLEAKLEELTSRLTSEGLLETAVVPYPSPGESAPDEHQLTVSSTDVEKIDMHPEGDVVFVCNRSDGKQV